MENIYKLSGIKSKVHTLKRLYNHRDSVCLNDYEPPVITSFIKLFLRWVIDKVMENYFVWKISKYKEIKKKGNRGW